MPFVRRPNRRRNRRRRIPGLATRPRMMPRTLALKRSQQVDTRVFWFKQNATITNSPNAFQYYEFRTTKLAAEPPPSFTALRTMYDQYKILGFKIRYFPANVGIEPHATRPGQTGDLTLMRGNHCLWVDQRYDPNVQLPTSIGEVINTASARLINPRRPYAISIWRPKGKYVWGSCKDINSNPDPWNGTINHIVEDATISVPPAGPLTIYFYTIQWKVIFRGRCSD